MTLLLRTMTAMLAAAFLAGCTGQDHQESATSTTQTASVEQLEPPFSSVWSAAPGIDLFSRPAELVRATQEALYLTQVYGPERTFPGYLDAIGGPKDPQNDPDYQFSTTSKSEYEPWTQIANTPMTNYYNLAELEVSSDGREVGALVCNYAIVAPNNTSTLENRATLFGSRIVLSGTQPDTGVMSSPDTDPAKSNPNAQMPPTWNVFGGWHIAKIDDLYGVDMPAPCRSWRAAQLPSLQSQDGDPTKQLPREPVKPQFPEWIPPNKA